MSLIATEITRALIDLMGTCVTARGYTSNCGASVYLGQLRGAATQAPAIFVLPGRQSGEVRYGELREVTRSYQITAYADLNDHPTLDEAGLVDLIIWDLRRCVESHEPTLVGLAQRVRYVSDQPGYREDGGSIVGAGLQYEIQYAVNLNDPETAL